MKHVGFTASYAVAPPAAPFLGLAPKTPEASQQWTHRPVVGIDANLSRFQADLAIWEQGTILQAQALWGQSSASLRSQQPVLAESAETIDQ